MSERRPMLKLRFGQQSPAVPDEAADDRPATSAEKNQTAHPIRAYDTASDVVRRETETHILVSLLPRAAEYAIESENNAEYAARACSDVPAALLRMWQEVGRFIARPDEERASAISKLMRQILSVQNRRRESSALDMAIRRAVRLANGTERERTLMARLGKQCDGSDE